MLYRNILYAGAAIAIGNGFALNPDGQVSPMISNDLAVTRGGHVEYVVPMPESGSGSSMYIDRHDSEQGDE